MESPKKLSFQFNKPLFVFRIKTPKIYDITRDMIKYIIDTNYVEYIYLENPSQIKNRYGSFEERSKHFIKTDSS
jgi:hypothetical protein